jgi:prophage regulatory protein
MRNDHLARVYLSAVDVAARYSIHRISVWKMAKAGRLPAPVKLHGLTRWRLADIEAAEQQTIQKAEATPIDVPRARIASKASNKTRRTRRSSKRDRR